MKKDFKRKIVSLEELKIKLKSLRRQGKKIVHCHGTFDLYHRGHLHQFLQAKEQGDILVISITADQYVFKGPGRPVFNQTIRAEIIAALEVIDFVIIDNHRNACPLIESLRPNVYVKGASNEENSHDPKTEIGLERSAIEKVGGRIFFSQEIPIHSTPLLHNYIDPYPIETLSFLNEFKNKHPLNVVMAEFQKLQALKVLVIGEAIIDQYDYVYPMEVSAKAGVIANRLQESEFFAGGALACANHAANFCSQVTLLSCLGSQNSYEDFIRKLLAPSIQPIFLIRHGLKTTIKRREVDQTYFRKISETYIFDDQPLSPGEEMEVLDLLKKIIDNFDMIMVCDYGHGFITRKIIDYLKRSPSFLAVHPQTNSANKGYNLITKYPRANLVYVDSEEARLAVMDRTRSYEEIAVDIKKTTAAEFVVISLGHRGSLVANGRDFFLTPALSKKITDTTGAGDAFFSMASIAGRAGLAPPLIGFLSNATAALATTYIGNKTSVNPKMLLPFISSLVT